MNRIDRLTALIVFLQGRQRTTVESIAERYEISHRTVYRDLAALQEAGVPIGLDPGKGYFIVKGYHLPPVMFNKKEAASLLAGEKLVKKGSETGLSESYVSALDKIRAVLRHEEKLYVDTLDRHMRIIRYVEKPETFSDGRIFDFLQEAVYNRELIIISYRSPYREVRTRRRVEPLGLLLMGDKWYLAGWCRMRNGYRMFRTDRIEEYDAAGEKLPDPPGHSLEGFYDQHLSREKDVVKVVFCVDRDYMRYMGDQKYYHGWISEKETDGGVEMTFLSPSLEYMSRWLLMWGTGVEVREPDQLRRRLGEHSEALYRHYVESSQPVDA